MTHTDRPSSAERLLHALGLVNITLGALVLLGTITVVAYLASIGRINARDASGLLLGAACVSLYLLGIGALLAGGAEALRRLRQMVRLQGTSRVVRETATPTPAPVAPRVTPTRPAATPAEPRMRRYFASVRRRSGQVEDVELHAPSEDHLYELARAKGWQVLAAKPV